MKLVFAFGIFISMRMGKSADLDFPDSLNAPSNATCMVKIEPTLLEVVLFTLLFTHDFLRL